MFGEDHPYFKEINAKHAGNTAGSMLALVGVLDSARKDIEQGWLTTLRGLVTADVFSDFLEMAEHLLEQEYKDPAAVMIGSVLEEHLRQLCTAHQIPIDFEYNGVQKPKKADTMNADLAKADLISKLDQKSVTAWLDLRNKAAHGCYTEYTAEQVTLLLQSVRDFITRHPL